MDPELERDIDNFLLVSISPSYGVQRDDYRKGKALLEKISPENPQYKWLEAKICRILRAIDK
jgi:hypothetical protein